MSPISMKDRFRSARGKTVSSFDESLLSAPSAFVCLAGYTILNISDTIFSKGRLPF